MTGLLLLTDSKRPPRTTQAEALIAQGFGPKRLARELGISERQACKLCYGETVMAERMRKDNARRRPAKREHDRNATALCVDCGEPRGTASRYGGQRCAECHATATKAHTVARRQQIMEGWHAGLPLREIADQLNSTKNSIGVEIHRMRKDGWDMPRRNRGYDKRADA